MRTYLYNMYRALMSMGPLLGTIDQNTVIIDDERKADRWLKYTPNELDYAGVIHEFKLSDKECLVLRSVVLDGLDYNFNNDVAVRLDRCSEDQYNLLVSLCGLRDGNR